MTRVVVSADTRSRLLRYIFPLKGAVTIRVQLSDEPGTFQLLAQALVDCDLNVLSALLRRGGAKHGNAEVVAICEPKSIAAATGLRNRVQRRIDEINQKYRMKAQFMDPKTAMETIYPRHPDEVVARVPFDLKPTVRIDKMNLSKGKCPVFISRRFFANSPRAERIAERLHKILEANGCVAVEALPKVGVMTPPFFQVSSKMWVSKAGIVLVAGPGIEGVDIFNFNLAHEYGFLQGQGKPILLLVEDGQQKSMEKWTNAYQINFQSFAADEVAFNPDHMKSLDRIATNWISVMKRTLNH